MEAESESHCNERVEEIAPCDTNIFKASTLPKDASRNDAKGEEIVRSPAVIKDPQLLVGWFSDATLDLTKILGIDFA